MKKKFKQLMKEWEVLYKSEEEVSKAIKKWNKDFNYLSLGIYHDLISKLFKIAFNDRNGEIDYYAFELNFGKEKWGRVDNRPIRNLNHVWRELERNNVDPMVEIRKEKDFDKYYKEAKEKIKKDVEEYKRNN